MPLGLARVSNLLRTSVFMSNVRQNTVEMLRAQTEMATLKKINRPSDKPVDGATVGELDKRLEGQQQFMDNMRHANSFLSTTDAALADAADLLIEAQSIASQSVGVTSSDSQRAANAQLVSGMVTQLVDIANRRYLDSYVFGGRNVDHAPFIAEAGGVRFLGDTQSVETQVDRAGRSTFDIGGEAVFGALSAQVVGIVDLDPTLTTATRLADLNGALGQGIRSGSFTVSDGATGITIDLTNLDTIGDVIDAISEHSNITATINAAGNGIELTSGTGSVDVREVGTGFAARDLGIQTGGLVASPYVGSDLDPKLTPLTLLSQLNAGADIDRANGLLITNGLLSATVTFPAGANATVQDMLNLINNAGVGVLAEINDQADGINIFNALSGQELRIGENGGTTAADLGIRSLVPTTLLAEMNGGLGIRTVTGNDFEIQTRDGATYAVDVSSATTLNDVMAAITAAAGGAVTVDLNPTGNGIRLTDNSVDAGFDFEVRTLNASSAAGDLGIRKTVANPAATINGDDTNPVMPDGLFSHIIALQNALITNDTQAITRAAEGLQADVDRVTQKRGRSGAMVREFESRIARGEDDILSMQSLKSQLQDADVYEAATRFQTLQTALQGNLITARNALSLSLLDFLA